MRNVNDVIEFVFLDVAVVIVVARAVGQLFRRFGQPAVVGEIVSGLLLGPTVLGAFPGHLDTRLFPTDVRPYLTVLANLGLVLFMFIVGMEVDLSLVRGRARIASSVSIASVATPFVIGIGLASILYSRHEKVAGVKVSFTAFALFIGVAMSITALPVLARMLADRGMQHTPLGVLSLACAVVDDVLAWTLLAVVVAVTVGGDASGVVKILLETAAFALVMALIVRPLLRYMVPLYNRAGRLAPELLVTVLAGTLISAYVTQKIGIHFIFGAFLFGVVMPRKDAAQLTREILERLEQVSMLLLLPVFFVVTGLGVDIGGIGAAGIWQLALVLLVAIVGKFSGASISARLQHVPRRQATALGVLMNTRGLTELIILQVGVQLGVLDQQMFTMLVVMAIITTIMTTPLLKVFYPPRVLQRDIEEAEQAALGGRDQYTVLVVTDDRTTDAGLVELGCDLLGHEQPARLVVARILERSAHRLEVASGLGVELAELASVTDRLRVLTATATARGATSSVQARFGDNPVSDVAELAERIGASLVIVYADWAQQTDADGQPASGRLPWPGEMSASIVAVPPDFTGAVEGGVTAVIANEADSRAALRVGAEASLGRRSRLVVLGGDGSRSARRATGAVEALERAGFPNAEAATSMDASTGLVVLGGDLSAAAVSQLNAPAQSCIRVFAGTRDSDRDMEEIAARIAAQ